METINKIIKIHRNLFLAISDNYIIDYNPNEISIDDIKNNNYLCASMPISINELPIRTKSGQIRYKAIKI